MEKLSNANIVKSGVDSLQINLGNLCNHSCTHCHIEASPKGTDIMSDETANLIIEKIKNSNIKKIEFTGGTPEMIPAFKLFLDNLPLSFDITVRTSLTVLTDDEYSHFADIYKDKGIRVVASMPAVFRESTDRQRGKGYFQKGIEALKMLNAKGVGAGGTRLDLVYNPVGDYLPSDQNSLKKDFKKILSDQYGITFDDLLAIANVPIKRFGEDLRNKGRYDDYLKLLKDSYNPLTLDKLMCRHMLSVSFDGSLYDCDFNLAEGKKLKGYEELKLWDVDLENISAPVTVCEYCYACTAGGGSSCGGELVEAVKQYYGDEIQKTEDLKTDACCTIEEIPDYVKEVLPYIADEIVARYYGCGSPIPTGLKGMNVLDLGCGTGKDSYTIAKLAGEDGFVTGIDMTHNQVEVAKRYMDDQMERFGFQKRNVEFIHDYIESVSHHFAPESLDVIVSNCVVNLVQDKEKVFSDSFKLLKEGGEMYFSDIYSDRRLPDEIRNNPVLYGECLGGAMYHKDFVRLVKRCGFIDPRVVSFRKLEINNKEIQDIIGNTSFYSITYRLWKLEGLEDACEDYGHVAVYKGGLPEHKFKLELDDGHVFEKNRPERVCGNTEKMLSRTRYSKYFDVIGSYDEHFGEFPDCETGSSYDDGEDGRKSFCKC